MKKTCFYYLHGSACSRGLLPGDVNHSNSIDIVDALITAQYYVGLNPGNFDAGLADVNASGNTDIIDVLLIAQYYAGLITRFPGQAATFTLTITISGNGSTSPAAGTHTCNSGTSVTVTAIPGSGAAFTGWSGAANSADASVTIVMNSNKNLTAAFTTSSTPAPGNNSLVGYAAVNGGTTGGKGGTTVTVSTGTALQDALKNKGTAPLIIHVNGVITPSNSGDLSKIDVKDISDVSIFNGEFNGIGIKLTRASNVIIRNVKLHHVNIGDKDAIGLQYSTNVWIDHNEIYSDTVNGKDYYDGAIDITHACDYVTVSFNYVHDHYKTSLVGHSDNNAEEDSGKLHVTYYGNYWKTISSRTPSFRFGTGHIFNNYMEIFFDASTAISSCMGARLRIENNVSAGVDDSVMTDQSDTPGAVQLIGNSFSGTVATSPACSLSIPYSYSLQPTNNVVNWCRANAGTGKVDPAVF